MSTCKASSVWFTYPLPRADVLRWMNDQLPEDNEYTLDTPAGYGDNHPMQIEFDTFTSCKTFLGLPYFDFQEIAVQIPYVTWRNLTVHFQPWALVNNIFGKAAMILLSSRSALSAGTSEKPKTPAIWSQSGKSTAVGSLSLTNANVSVLVDSATQEEGDASWREMVKVKKELEAVYINHYACNNIAWNFAATRVAKVSSGTLDIAPVQTAVPSLFPAKVAGEISMLRKSVPGFEAYGVETEFTATIGGCGSDMLHI